MNKFKIIRATTVPLSLNTFCKGMLKELSEKYEVLGLSSPAEELMERRISLVSDIKSLIS